jgi:hypothetical protein
LVTKKFKPETPLADAVYKGDRKGVIALLAPLSHAGRQRHRSELSKLDKLMEKARFAYGDRTFAGWGRNPSDEQYRALAAGVFLCGTAKDVAGSWIKIDDLMELARKFPPPWLADLGEEMMDMPGSRGNIRDVQRLISEGLVRRPQSEGYILGLMQLFAGSLAGETTIEAQFKADPGLKDVLLRVLEVEGVSDVSLAAIDKYTHEDHSWSKRLLALSQSGVYSRAVLIDKVLSALERGWIQFRSGWFSQFHELLDPGIEEMRPHAQRYVALMASRIPPTVTFALGAVKQLEDAGELPPLATLDAIRPVLSSAVKSQVENALKLIDRVVNRAPAFAGTAAKIIIPALAHESAAVQQQILKRLDAWKLDAESREALKPYARGIAATNRDALTKLMGADAGPSARAPGPAVPSRAAPQEAPRNSLDANRRMTPIATLDELVERVAYVFENDTDIDEFERALAALSRFAPFSDEVRTRFAPLAKRIAKVRKPVAQQLARMLEFLLTGKRAAADSTVDHFGHKAKAQLHMIARVNDLIDFAPGARGATPLGEPTHRRGFIDATEFVRRLAAHQAAGVKSSRADFLVGLMRIAPESAASARGELEALADDPLAEALRFALGEDVKVRDRELSGAAQKIRQMCAGIDPAERTWEVEVQKYGNNKVHRRVAIEVRTGTGNLDPVTAMANSLGKVRSDVWYSFPTVGGIDAGSILYFASLLPADLEVLFVDGASLLSRNIDWWEAQWENVAYLRQLLHSDVPMKPLATLTLALGLAGKEPGQTAVAVDALVQSSAEGRLDAKLLAAQVAELLRSGHAACARYAKSLAAALRIDEAVAPALLEVLSAAAVARPDDPPKDTAALLELLLEIVVARDLRLPSATIAAIDSLQIGGRGKAVRKELLARS